MKIEQLERVQAEYQAGRCSVECYLDQLVNYHLEEVLYLRTGLEKILATDETETASIMLDLRKLLDDSPGLPKQAVSKAR